MTRHCQTHVVSILHAANADVNVNTHANTYSNVKPTQARVARRFSTSLLVYSSLFLLAACSSAPSKPVQRTGTYKPAAQKHITPKPVEQKTTASAIKTPAPAASVNPITRLPPQTEPVPASVADMPAFGSDAFNRIKDTYPDNPPDISQVPDAIPQDEPLAKYGNKSPYTVLGATYRVLPSAKGFKQTGKASFYGKKFHGLRTSSGETYDMYAMSAAHRNLPLPSYVRVTNTANGRSVIVKVNDRGPFHSDRVMDLSYSAAARLDILKAGTGNVRIEAIEASEFPKTNEAITRANPVTPSTTEEPNYFVQVGAFSAKGNASALQNQLADIIYSPVNVVLGDGIHRVQVGPFFSRDDAEKAATIIAGKNLGKAIVVQR